MAQPLGEIHRLGITLRQAPRIVLSVIENEGDRRAPGVRAASLVSWRGEGNARWSNGSAAVRANSRRSQVSAWQRAPASLASRPGHPQWHGSERHLRAPITALTSVKGEQGARRIRRLRPARPNRAHPLPNECTSLIVDCRFRFEASRSLPAEDGARS